MPVFLKRQEFMFVEQELNKPVDPNDNDPMYTDGVPYTGPKK